MKKISGILFFLFVSVHVLAQHTDTVRIKNDVFEVLYSQDLEQPLYIKYRSINRPNLVKRGSMDFYEEEGIITSDDADYYRNVYDKGHGAPAASFSDSIEILKQTFTYLNSIMQNQYLNRGAWKHLEAKEREWDDLENLTIVIKTFFNDPPLRVTTNAAVPSHMEKHVYFETQKMWRCFSFLNEKPQIKWNESQIICEEHR